MNEPSRHKLTRATPRLSVVDTGWEWERGGVVSAPLAIVLGEPDEGYVVIEGTHPELAAMLHSMALHLGVTSGDRREQACVALSNAFGETGAPWHDVCLTDVCAHDTCTAVHTLIRIGVLPAHPTAGDPR